MPSLRQESSITFDSIREIGSPGDVIVDCDDVVLDWGGAPAVRIEVNAKKNPLSLKV